MAVIEHHKDPHNTSHIDYSCFSRFTSVSKTIYLYIYLPDEGYSRNASCALNCISTFSLLSQGRYLCCGGLLVPEGIIRSVVGASALTWFIRYIYYWNLQFLNNVIINKTEVLLPQIGDLISRFCLSRLDPLVLLLPITLNYLAFQSFDFQCTWWRLFQKRVMRTKFDIYVFIIRQK